MVLLVYQGLLEDFPSEVSRVLKIKGLTKYFSGLAAVNELGFVVDDSTDETEEFKEEREQEMTDGILKFQPDMHIGGIQHAFEEYAESLPVDPLYERLGNLVSRRIRLCEAMKE